MDQLATHALDQVQSRSFLLVVWIQPIFYFFLYFHSWATLNEQVKFTKPFIVRNCCYVWHPENFIEGKLWEQDSYFVHYFFSHPSSNHLIASKFHSDFLIDPSC